MTRNPNVFLCQMAWEAPAGYWHSHTCQQVTGDLGSQRNSVTFSIAAVCSISYTVSKYLVVASPAREGSRPAELFFWLGIAFFLVTFCETLYI